MFDKTLQRFGLVRKEKLDNLTAEIILADVPPKLRASLEQDFKDLNDLKTLANPEAYYSKHIEIGKKLQHARSFTKAGGPVDKALKRFMSRTNGNVFGYSPAGAKMWGHFSNPMEVFAYLYDNWWAFKVAVDRIETEVESGGFVLRGAKGVSQKKLMQTYKKLKELDVDKLFTKAVTHRVQFGNFYMFPHTTRKDDKDDLLRLEVLSPTRLSPLFHNRTNEIVGYEYRIGQITRKYLKEQVLHSAMASGGDIGIGTPPILPAVLPVETALYADMLNNTIFQKGGILGVLVAMEEPKNDDQIGGDQSSRDWIDLIQEKFNSEAGARGGHGTMVIPGKATVHKLTDPGSIDTNWDRGKDYAAKITAECCGVPPEILGLVRSSALQYSPALVEDSVNAQLDATINRHTSTTADFFNREVMEKLLGIYDIKLMPTRRTGAKTKTATEALNNLAQGGWITRNEGRVEWLSMEELPGREGQEIVCLNAVERNPESLPPRVPQQNPDPDFASMEDGKNKAHHLPDKFELNEENSYSFLVVGGERDGLLVRSLSIEQPRSIKCR